VSGRKRRPSKGRDGTRTALCLRVSTADQTCGMTDFSLRRPRQPRSRSGLLRCGVSGRREGRTQLNALMAAVRNNEIDCVPGLEIRPLCAQHTPPLVALEAFNHLGVRFISVQDQVDIG
jgi:hypothetical protein